VPTATLFLVLGILESRSEPGGVAERVLNWHMLVAFGIYFLWALVQQFLVQFYLLGRLLTILPAAPAVVLTGLTYSLVHLPEIGVTAVTAVAGIVWTGIYRRYRVLIPLAFSHAFLGTTFYYWVYGRDLFGTWSHGG
jgi:membrane protease YdiL (CAAX protease family)